ncbi:MAG: hypothetical protein R2849_06640 [Thermomicrobiales bacterium]
MSGFCRTGHVSASAEVAGCHFGGDIGEPPDRTDQDLGQEDRDDDSQDRDADNNCGG